MAEFLKKIPTNLTEYPNSFKRQGAFPLEAYSVFYTKAEADTYAASDPLAYVGQTIAVALDSGVTLYVIDQNSQLKEVGSLPVGDEQSVSVVDGKIQLVNFGTSPNGAVAQIEVAEDGTRTLVWTPIDDLTADHEERITHLEEVVEDGVKDAEGNIITKPLTTRVDELEGTASVRGAVKTVEHANGEYILKDSKGNEVGRIPIAEAVTNFAYHAEYTGKDGKEYDNVLVLELSNGEEQIIEIEDLVKIYEEEKNATEVQITITPSTGPTDPDEPASDNPNVISAKLTDSVKEAINQGVEAHEGLSNVNSDVRLQSEENNHTVVLSDSVRENVNKGVTAYNAIFDGTTTFVLNGGNASGYTVATDESTEV